MKPYELFSLIWDTHDGLGKVVQLLYATNVRISTEDLTDLKKINAIIERAFRKLENLRHDITNKAYEINDLQFDIEKGFSKATNDWKDKTLKKKCHI